MGSVSLKVGSDGALIAHQHQNYWLAIELRLYARCTAHSVEFAPYTETKIGTVSCTTPIEFLVHADNILLVRHESADPICLTITMEGDEPVTLNNVASGDQIGVVACHGSQRLVIQKE